MGKMLEKKPKRDRDCPNKNIGGPKRRFERNDVSGQIAFYLESSVTFLGDFWMFLATNLITKVAQIYGKF